MNGENANIRSVTSDWIYNWWKVDYFLPVEGEVSISAGFKFSDLLSKQIWLNLL